MYPYLTKERRITTEIHTEASIELLKEIEEKSNIVWASGDRPIIGIVWDMSKYLDKLLFLNYFGDNELTTRDHVENKWSVQFTNEEFIAECVRIAPKKEEKP